ncbi:cytochrome P450 [Lentzea aerocolonigenes]|uniref:cytochrome P450 n=1 Tax=Lentzea aerocolonigenes TaxID=68170 RepID=UPI0004C3001E|nr:cytochrome P450 [Lentzea aerocolonigenes]MCP2247203.1 Cytochrome P450 [Lentzea aerocolonigenes]
MPSVTTVPGRWPLIGHTVTLLRSPVEFLSSLPARGDVVRVFLGPLPVHLVTTPELALQLLTSDKFDKGIVFDKMRPLFGNGLATSNGAFNQRQRRMVLPAFTRARVATYAETVITSLATELRDSWHDGQRLEFDRVMQDFVMTVAGRTLFSAELGQEVLDEIKHSIPIMLKHVLVRAFSPGFVEKLPLKANREFDEAAARLRKIIPEVVVGARKEGGDHGDLLSALLAARDADTGEAMTDEQIHDEVVTILTTGAETTAVALAWFFHEVGTRPEVRQRFHAEVDAVLGDRPATFEDVAKLEYTGRIINEVLRRTPPIILMRRAREDVEIGGVLVRKGSEVAVSQHTLHRDPRWFPNPGQFDPDRWEPARAAAVPKGAFIPFGAGSRFCPGHFLAHTEIAIAAATIATRWDLVPVAGQRVYAQVKATMQPNRLPVTATSRRPQA